MSEICSKFVIDVVLVSLLATLNGLHTMFCFYCWISTSNFEFWPTGFILSTWNDNLTLNIFTATFLCSIFCQHQSLLFMVNWTKPATKNSKTYFATISDGKWAQCLVKSLVILLIERPSEWPCCNYPAKMLRFQKFSMRKKNSSHACFCSYYIGLIHWLTIAFSIKLTTQL